MWVTKLLISEVKKRIFCPKTTKFGPKLAFLVNLGQAMQLKNYEKLIPDVSNGYKVYFTISATQHIERNVPEDPCVEDEDYKFHVCVKRNLARKLGCQPSWDVRWTENQTIPNCTEISEHRWGTSTTRV